MQHISNAARAGSTSQPKKARKGGESCKGNFQFCPCHYCQFQASCVFVSFRDRDAGYFSADEYQLISGFFGQWGEVVGLFLKSRCSILVQ